MAGLRSARVTVLVENSTVFIDGRIAEYGLSMLVEATLDNGDSVLVLLDTGQTGRPLLHNLEAEGVKPSEIDYLVLSHRHSDHTGGLKAFLEARRGKPIPVIAHPGLFEPSVAVVDGVLYEIGMPITRNEAESLGARFVLTREPLQIVPGVWFSGEVPSRWGPRHTKLVYRIEDGRLVEDEMRDDAFLALSVGRETYVITGCGHAGVENILGYASEITGNPVAGLIGGLHLFGVSGERVEEIIEALRKHPLKILAGMHCTGPFIQERLRREFPQAYRLMATGSRARLPP
ncbi:MBL fold metallo-hydrolase [Pyrodictium abyssi]|uniref:MBL fold metallo-hydrolase n=1 Tax=Pyrodictium abyssi TaxID=54256 RepID=A0ABN6ZUX5_9CREN|nr:MBL fold metallo-hydrolase [Pyrodictium abyssi]